MADLALAGDLNTHFALPLLVEAYQQYQQISVLLAELNLKAGNNDHRSFVWGDKYTLARFYKFMFEQMPRDAALNAIWKPKSLPKLKAFSWLLMHDRLNTRDLMLRKNWNLDLTILQIESKISCSGTTITQIPAQIVQHSTLK